MNKIKNIILLYLCIANLHSARGDLISYELINEASKEHVQEVLDSYLSTAPICSYDLQMYSLEYETIDQFGNVEIASGAIVVPVDQLQTFPLLSFHHGTQIQRSGTYSQNGNLDLLTMWLGTSYVSLIPDYLGLGVSEVFHPYQINIPSATASIDMIFAAKEFCELNSVYINDQLFLTGYSEGGYVTAAVQKMIEEEYTDTFDIAASTLCAGAYDMSGTMFDLMISEEEYGEPYYLPYIIFSYHDSYEILDDISDYFLPEYSDTLQTLFDGDYGAGSINSVMPSIPISVMDPDLVEEVVADYNHPFRQRLRENDLYDWAPQSPTIIIHSYGDELVPYQNAEVAYEYFINNGASDVSLSLVNFGGHQEAAPNILIGGYYWFEQLRETQYFSLGDLNIDFNVDILDIVILTNIVIEEISANNTQMILSDFNYDSTNDILDIILLVNLILSD